MYVVAAFLLLVITFCPSEAQNLDIDLDADLELRHQPQQQQCVYQISVPRSSEGEQCPGFLEVSWDLQQLMASNQQLQQTVEELQTQLSNQKVEIQDIIQLLENRDKEEITNCRQLHRVFSEVNFLNEDFESEEGWSAYSRFSYVDSEAYTGSFSIQVTLDDVAQTGGAVQTLTFNEGDYPIDMVVYGWSKAVNVQGSQNSDYSIYCDIVKSDGSPSYGHTGDFNVGTHDWEEKQVHIQIEAGIKQATCYALFRHKTGTVYFDNVYAELRGPCKNYCNC